MLIAAQRPVRNVHDVIFITSVVIVAFPGSRIFLLVAIFGSDSATIFNIVAFIIAVSSSEAGTFSDSIVVVIVNNVSIFSVTFSMGTFS